MGASRRLRCGWREAPIPFRKRTRTNPNGFQRLWARASSPPGTRTPDPLSKSQKSSGPKSASNCLSANIADDESPSVGAAECAAVRGFGAWLQVCPTPLSDIARERITAIAEAEGCGHAPSTDS